MIKRMIALLLALVTAAGLAACAEKKTPAEPVEKPAEQEPAAAETPPVAVSYTLTADTFDDSLMRYIASVTEGSYMVSPLSFRYALGLLLAGAAGDTRAELLTGLGISSEEEWEAYCADFNSFAAEYTAAVEAEREEYRGWVENGWMSPEEAEPGRALRVANSVWKREDIAADFTAEYREKIASYAAEYLSFTEENAVKRINAWADEKTEGLIPALLPEDYDASDLAVVLMNALYFKDSWSTPFSEYRTEDGDFTLPDGTVLTKTYMNNEENFPYYEDGDTQLVILPMGSGVNMAFVLGSTDNLAEKLAGAERQAVRVTVPKIDLETTFGNSELVDFLKASGVHLAFDSLLADFSGMLSERVWVDDIIQKTRLKTDEKGVEAAAVTAIMLKDECVFEPENPKVFVADRPFSFFIYSTAPGGTLQMMFAGEIRD